MLGVRWMVGQSDVYEKGGFFVDVWPSVGEFIGGKHDGDQVCDLGYVELAPIVEELVQAPEDGGPVFNFRGTKEFPGPNVEICGTYQGHYVVITVHLYPPADETPTTNLHPDGSFSYCEDEDEDEDDDDDIDDV
jgi:hypothetical protein